MKPFAKTKPFIAALALALAVVSLAACGDNNASGGDRQTSPSPSASAGAPSGDSGKTEPDNTRAGGKKEGGNVVVVIPQDLDYLDPQLAVAAGTSEVLFNIFEGLLKPNEKGELYPAVAESYEISPDGLTYTFKLRSGVKFHNGQAVTSADVKFSYNRLAGIGTGKPLSTAFGSVQSIEAPDPSTVVIKLKENNSSFLTALTAAIIPNGYEDSNKQPVGTGPFKFKEYLPGQRLVVEKFADYYVKGVPSLDQVEFRIVTDPEAALLALKSGEVDIYPRIGTEKLEELDDAAYTKLSAPQNLVQLMTFNIARKPFDDIRVRQAINYAVDKDEIIQGVALGKGTKLGSNISPVLAKYYQPGLEDTYPTDIDKAKSLLAEAGYKDGFETTLSVPSNYQFHVDTAQVIAQQLEKIGIKVKIETVEWAVWLDRIYKGRDYDLTIIGLDGKLNPYDILNKYLSDARNNFFNYKSEAFDETLKAAVKEIDDAKQVELYKKAQTILAQDAAAVYIMDPNLNVALSNKLAGYKQYPLYVQDLSTVYFTE
jgi:peptide/nickel transport system substrate-binding protein